MMDLERLAAAVGAVDVVGRAPVELSDLAYDAGRSCPAPRSSVSGARTPTGTTSRATRLPPGRRRSSSSAGSSVPVPQVVVADTRAAMAPAADEFFGRPTETLEVAGVTGTNGKTTTSVLLFAILAAAGRRPGLVGTIEARVGGERRGVKRTTPEAIDLQRLFREMLDSGDRSAAIEASSHASALHRLDRVRFAALVFTNLSHEHLDFHADMEDYFQAKRRLFLEGSPPAAVNIGDEYGRRLAAELPEALTFGFADDAAVGPSALDGIDLKLRGRFNVENALGALAAARLLGIDDDAIARGLESVRGVPGRFETIDEGQPFTVIVDYAHKPVALETLLRTARELATGRVLVRVRVRRRPRPREAAADGAHRLRARGRRDRHDRQSAQRGSAGDHRRDRRRRGRGRRGRARPHGGDCTCDRVGARR